MKPACGNMVLFFMRTEDYEASDSYYALGTLRTSYPHAGVFNEYTATNRSLSLAFSLEQDINGGIPIDTLYSYFWSRYIARIFAKSSRRVSMKGYLPVGEWLNLQMNQTIRVGDYYYKIEDISYNMTTGEANLNLFTYTPVTITKPDSGNGEVGFPANYVQPVEENIIFPNPVLNDLNNVQEVNGTKYVNLGQIPKNVSQMQYVVQGMTNVIANQYPKHLHMEKAVTSIPVSANAYTIVVEYDSLADYNNGNISGSTTAGQFTTDLGTWVKLAV